RQLLLQWAWPVHGQMTEGKKLPRRPQYESMSSAFRLLKKPELHLHGGRKSCFSPASDGGSCLEPYVTQLNLYCCCGVVGCAVAAGGAALVSAAAAAGWAAGAAAGSPCGWFAAGVLVAPAAGAAG